jgi:hypothetical protein
VQRRKRLHAGSCAKGARQMSYLEFRWLCWGMPRHWVVPRACTKRMWLILRLKYQLGCGTGAYRHYANLSGTG